MKLLIVEDEDIIRKGFIVTIHKLQLDFEQIYEARDGQEALRQCQAQAPDIIITDIRMPLMDGLTFIKESQALLPESQYIILSGYSDFKYARTALQYGVKDYLLKPSTNAEIKNVLLRLISNMKQKNLKMLELSERFDTYQRKLDRFQELLLGNILIGRYPSTEICQCLSHYSIHFYEKLMAVMCIKMYPDASSDEASIDYKTHFLWLTSLLERYIRIYHTDILSVYKTILLNFSQKEWERMQNDRSLIRDEIKRYEEEQSILIRFSMSRPKTAAEALPSLYEEASMLLHYRLFVKDTIILDAKSVKYLSSNEPAVPLTKIETVYHYFLGNSQFDLRQNFISFVRHIMSVADTSPQYFISCMKKLEEYFTYQLAQDNPTSKITYQIELSSKEAFTTCESIEELIDVLYKKLLSFRKLIKEGNSISTNSVSSPVDYAISYIEQNYYMDLTLGMMADLISMNSSYFSSLFKKKTGLNFVNYLQNVRIERSKKLLLHSNQKLYEISEAVGIANEKYFFKMFKDYTGFTPSEFRKENAKK